MENALNLDTVKLAENKKEIVILDQTLLPNECKYLSISKAGDIWEAIYSLRVRGAPAIGVTGAYAYYVLADQIETEDKDKFVKECTEMMEYINSSRPTAVNLSWALNRMHNVMLTEKDHMNSPDLKVRLMKEADAIREEDIQISRNIGTYGFELLEKLGKGVGIMTHCNAGTLATAKYGTALAPMYIALEHGWDPKKDLHVYCDETRPLLQGARLSAYEMQAAGNQWKESQSNSKSSRTGSFGTGKGSCICCRYYFKSDYRIIRHSTFIRNKTEGCDVVCMANRCWKNRTCKNNGS